MFKRVRKDILWINKDRQNARGFAVQVSKKSMNSWREKWESREDFICSFVLLSGDV